MHPATSSSCLTQAHFPKEETQENGIPAKAEGSTFAATLSASVPILDPGRSGCSPTTVTAQGDESIVYS